MSGFVYHYILSAENNVYDLSACLFSIFQTKFVALEVPMTIIFGNYQYPIFSHISIEACAPFLWD